MVVRLKLQYGESLERARVLNRQLALATSFLLTPGAVVCTVLGCWRMGADLNLTGEFAISTGFFSHWQVWLALGAGLQTASVLLNRYANREDLPDDASAV